MIKKKKVKLFACLKLLVGKDAFQLKPRDFAKPNHIKPKSNQKATENGSMPIFQPSIHLSLLIQFKVG